MTRLETDFSGAGHSAMVVMLWMRRIFSPPTFVKTVREKKQTVISSKLFQRSRLKLWDKADDVDPVSLPKRLSRGEEYRQSCGADEEQAANWLRRSARRFYSVRPVVTSDWALVAPHPHPPSLVRSRLHVDMRAIHTSKKCSCNRWDL